MFHFDRKRLTHWLYMYTWNELKCYKSEGGFPEARNWHRVTMHCQMRVRWTALCKHCHAHLSVCGTIYCDPKPIGFSNQYTPFACFPLVGLVFLVYRFIPLLPDLRQVMDWMFTDTALSLINWLKVQNIYIELYLMKVQRERELVRGRGYISDGCGLVSMDAQRYRNTMYNIAILSVDYPYS